MRTVTYKSLLEGALRLRAIDPAAADLSALLAMGEYLNLALNDCHEYWRWPELLVTGEPRFYRAAWTAQAYNAASEVWHAPTLAYYRANLNTLAGDVPGTSAKWDALTLFSRYIDYQQAGQTAIEAVLEAYDGDPKATTTRKKVYFEVNNAGIQFAPDAPNEVWLDYRIRCPDFGWSAIWSAVNFAVNTIVYDANGTGEVWLANQAAGGGDVPGVSGKWTKQNVPYIFRQAAKVKAFALWCESNGQTETALIFDNNDPANPGKFQNALDDQVWQYTKLQGQTGRVNTLPPK